MGGSRSRNGWSGPVRQKQSRGSNTMSPQRRSQEPKKEAKPSDEGRPAKGASGPRVAKGTVPRKVHAKEPQATVREADGAPERAPEVVIDGDLHGPERIKTLKSTADKMVVGERTVIHHAARYGIVRGMTWTVILSALLFWLPVAGPAVAGYVGGRKAGGPLRGVIAVLIPALVMFILMAAVSENLDLVPTSMVTDVQSDLDSMTEVPAAALPLVSGLEHSINAWVLTPPDVVFIMLAFAIVGGALSSLRRREEETVIEKVGIPLAELKERVLKEEAEKGGQAQLTPPSRWHPHRILSSSAAAHDTVNEMVDDIAFRVYQYMQTGGVVDETGAVAPRARPRRRVRKEISTGEEGPHYEELVYVEEALPEEPAPRPSGSRRSRRGAQAAASSLTPRTAAEAISGDEGDWMVVDTSKGRRPVRVVHSPMVAVARERPVVRVEAQEPPARHRGEVRGTPVYLAEPQMHVERQRVGLLRRSRPKVVYSAPDDVMTEVEPVYYTPAPSPHGGPATQEEAGEGTRTPTRLPAHRNYERLPIVGPILASVSHEGEDVRYGTLKSLDEPSLHDTFEAGSIAQSAARELAEMARFEEGPDLEHEEDQASRAAGRRKPRARPRARAEVPEVLEEEDDAVGPEGPEPGDEAADGWVEEELPVTRPERKVRSTARRVKHPTGALKSGGKGRSRRQAREEYDDDLAEEGEAVWESPSAVEEEDLFNPRRLEDDVQDGDGHPEGSDAWAEEERIAAIVREREEWDRL